MHIASFDDGSEASLIMFAEELRDLWENPIVVNGMKYIVALGQILMDDKGRESFCGVQGGTSKAGCNICHFESRLFVRRQVHDGIRRYLARNDPTRKKDSAKNQRYVVVRTHCSARHFMLYYVILCSNHNMSFLTFVYNS